MFEQFPRWPLDVNRPGVLRKVRKTGERGDHWLPGRVSRKDQGEIKIPKKIAIKTSRIYVLSKTQYSFLFTFKPSFLYILSQYL